MPRRKKSDLENTSDSKSENKIQIFDNPEFGEVRVVELKGQPYFVGKDVAEILGYKNSRKAIADHIDEEDKGVTKCDTLGGIQELAIINESGLYSLILSSKLPTAKKFKHWVTSEVLPSIRKTGMYATEELLANPDLAIKAFTALKEEREKNKKLSKEIDDLTVTNKALTGDILSWEHRGIINALVRAYSGKVYCGNFSHGWNEFYRNLLYKEHINLKARHTISGNKGKIIDCLKDGEFEKAIKAIAAMCDDVGIKIARVLNEVDAEMVGI